MPACFCACGTGNEGIGAIAGVEEEALEEVTRTGGGIDADGMTGVTDGDLAMFDGSCGDNPATVGLTSCFVGG